MLQHIKLHHSSTSNRKDFKEYTNSNDDQEIPDEYSDNEADYKSKSKNKRKSMVSKVGLIRKCTYFFGDLVNFFIRVQFYHRCDLNLVMISSVASNFMPVFQPFYAENQIEDF